MIVHNSLNYSNLPIIKHYLTKIIYRNSCYFGFYPCLCNVIRKTNNEQLKILELWKDTIILQRLKRIY